MKEEKERAQVQRQEEREREREEWDRWRRELLATVHGLIHKPSLSPPLPF